MNTRPQALAWMVLGMATVCAAAPGSDTTLAQHSVPAATGAARSVVRSSTLALRSLFEGERLSAATKARLDAMIDSAADLDVEMALLVPSGPWRLDRRPVDERSLTPARLEALRAYLSQRGVPAARIYVESRIDDSATEPRLVVELVGRPTPH